MWLTESFFGHTISICVKERCITREQIVASIANYEIIEEYPEDKYLPSYLIYSRHHSSVFHILFAIDFEGDNVRVVTAYTPDPAEWESGFKMRSRKP